MLTLWKTVVVSRTDKCVQVACEEVREECGYEVVEEVEEVPVETCGLQYREDQLCQDSQQSLSQCGLVVSRVCSRQRRRRRRRRRMKKPDRAKP